MKFKLFWLVPATAYVACSIWFTGCSISVFCSGCSRGGAATAGFLLLSHHRPAVLLLLSSWLGFINRILMVGPWLRLSVASLSPQRPGFDPRSFCVTFVLDRMELGQILLKILRFYPVGIIPPMLRTHSFICHRRSIIVEIDSVAANHTG